MFRYGIVWVLFIVTLSACSSPAPPRAHREPQPSPTPASVPPPSTGPTFTLGAEGLPTSGIWKSDPLLSDVNKDGFLDIVALPRLGEGTRVWFGNGAGAWTDASDGLQLPSSCGGDVDAGDVNKDGHLDLAVADHCSGVYVYLGDGQGHWKAAIQELNPNRARKRAVSEDADNPFAGAESLALGDVNEDGFLDLVVTASYQGGLAVYLGNGSGKSWQEAAVPNGLPCEEDPEPGDSQSGGWANRILLRDIDGDGHLDVAASYYAGPRVWRGDGQGRWQPYSQGLPRPLIGGLFWGIDVGDVNADGRLDLAVANTVNGPEVFLQTQDGSWRQTPDVMPALLGGAMSVALGDMNGDGHLDIITGGIRSKKVEEGYGIFVLSGNGKGGWTEEQRTGLPAMSLSFPWGVSLPDVDRDGRLDLAVTTGGTIAGKAEETQPRKSSLPLLQVWLNRP